MALFKLGTLGVPHLKNTAASSAVRMAPPKEVKLPTSMHIGAPARVTVKAGDEVFVGTTVAVAGGYVSSPVHSSVSGKVKKIDEILNYAGEKIPTVIIESDGLMTPDPTIAPPKIESLDDLCQAVRESGIVGLGGAGFPTAVKLDGAKSGGIRKLILNGAECEPYITSDTRTMLDDAEDIKAGVELLSEFIPFEEIHVGIEKNKGECIKKMTEVFSSDNRVVVHTLPDTYPQGAEKVLIYNTAGLVVPEGKLPADVGVIVLNVTTVANIAKYVKSGMPLVEKCVTVDGSAIKEPKNVICPIGTPISELIGFVGGCLDEAGKILYGGPMMGVAIYDAESPVLKNTNAITVLNDKDAKQSAGHPCIHCGRCASVCPIGLTPTEFAKAMNIDDHTARAEMLSDNKVNLCMECGCCSYICPSRRPLVQTNRLAKAELREYKSNSPKE